MIAALLCASLAARGAALVPARAEAAVLFDGEAGIAGLHQFLEAAGTKSRALAPRELSRELTAAVGADLLSGAPGWGLDPRGARALVFAGAAFALSAPVRDGKAARKALIAWVGAAGPWSKRTGTRNPIAAGSGRSQRAGIVAPQRGSLRLLTASGRGAEGLVAALWRIGAQRSPTRTLAHDNHLQALLPAAGSKATVIVRGADPITFAVLDLTADASGVVARGLVGAPSPLLAGHAPDPSSCADSVLFCLRAGLGLSGKAALALASQTYLSWTSPSGPLADLVQREATRAGSLAVMSNGLDVSLLDEPRSSLWALHLVAAMAGATARDRPLDLDTSDGPRKRCLHAEGSTVQISSPCLDLRVTLREGDGPALQATADPAAFDAALSRLNAFDALRGSVPATMVGARLLIGGLLRGSRPFTLSGEPDPLGARIELRWSLR
jgi:hypothetical protein